MTMARKTTEVLNMNIATNAQEWTYSLEQTNQPTP